MFDLGSIVEYLIYIVSLIIPILMWVAVLVFFWGIVVFISNAGDEKKIAEGKQLIVWGLIGLFVIVSMWGIIGFIQDTLGLNGFSMLGNLPEQPDYIPTP